MNTPREKIKEDLKPLWDKGYKEGPKSRKHASQFLQEKWNKWVLFAKKPMSYFEFKAWESGYHIGRHHYFWGIGDYNEYANDEDIN